MTLYDQYRKEHPIASEPSEFREIVESEVKQALEWYKDGCSWCDKPTKLQRPTTEEAEKAVGNFEAAVARFYVQDVSAGDRMDLFNSKLEAKAALIKMITGGVS